MHWGRLDLLDLLDELVFRQGSLESLDLVALAGQNITAALVHIFQQEDLNILRVERLQRLGRALLLLPMHGPQAARGAKRRGVESRVG